jgi:hypothetical protein
MLILSKEKRSFLFRISMDPSIPTNERASVDFFQLEQHTFKNVNNCLNTNIYSYLETYGVQSSNLYLNVVPIFNTRFN